MKYPIPMDPMQQSFIHATKRSLSYHQTIINLDEKYPKMPATRSDTRPAARQKKECISSLR